MILNENESNGYEFLKTFDLQKSINYFRLVKIDNVYHLVIISEKSNILVYELKLNSESNFGTEL